MDLITNLLYWLTTGLLIPVTLALIALFAYAIVLLGLLHNTRMMRNRTIPSLNSQINAATPVAKLLASLPLNETREPLSTALQHVCLHQTNALLLDKIAGDYEIATNRLLNRSRLLAKVGPMLGLMGTLIPMGPALVGLATGDIASMASNMQVAFATTVVGIIIGAVGFVTLQVQQRWAANDTNILQYLVESLKQQHGHENL